MRAIATRSKQGLVRRIIDGSAAVRCRYAAVMMPLSFALGHPRLASVLFGATNPEQLRQNVASLDVFASLDEQHCRQLDQLAAS